MTMENDNYGAEQIQVLEGLEAVRKRPGMYIGSTSSTGLHHLVYEIVDNSVDEALAGYCTHIQVYINEDNSITVVDDGRGIPVGIHKKQGIPAVEVVFTILHAGGKFGGGGYKVSGGLHGVGASVVNALSTWLEVEITRDGKVYKQRYEKGKVMYKLQVIGEAPEGVSGTKVTFLPDHTIFEDNIYDYDILRNRLREMAFLTKGLKISLTDKRLIPEKVRSFHYEGGIKEFVTYLNRHRDPLYNEVIYCEGVRDGISVEVALQHNDSYNESTYSFVNNINTPEGGTHLTGFKSAITKVFNDYARKNNIIKEKDDNLSGDDLREGLAAIVSIKISDPQFEGQTKQKLGNSEARPAVESVVTEQLTYYLEQNPQIAKIIVNKAAVAQRARIAARKARDVARKANLSDNMALPGKLADCSDKDPKNCEIYIVEGDSAERNIIVNFSAINFCGEVFFVKESRYISKCYIKYLSIFDFCFGTDNSCRSIQNNFCIRFYGRNKSCFDDCCNRTDCSVAAHIQIFSSVHEDHTKISFRVDRICQKSTKHIMMSTWLKHQSLTVFVVMLCKKVLTFDHCIPFKLRET